MSCFALAKGNPPIAPENRYEVLDSREVLDSSEQRADTALTLKDFSVASLKPQNQKPQQEEEEEEEEEMQQKEDVNEERETSMRQSKRSRMLKIPSKI